MTLSSGLVLGATGGIGGACVRALASSVERVVLVGRDPGRLAAVAAAVGPAASPLEADVSNAADRELIIAAVTGTSASFQRTMRASLPLDVYTPNSVVRPSPAKIESPCATTLTRCNSHPSAMTQ